MDHQRHRKIMNPAFSAAHLRSFLPLIQGFSSKVSAHRPVRQRAAEQPERMFLIQLADMWRAELTSDTNGGEMTVMVNKWFSRVTLDIIGEGQCGQRASA